MKLAETILENKRKGQTLKNAHLVKLRLKELIFAYPNEISQVLIKTGVKLRSELPAKVLFAIVVKHINQNDELRDAIAQMLLEMDGFHNADGQWAGIIGGALSAVGSVLSGVGRGQYNNTDEQQQLLLQQQKAEQAQLAEQAKRRQRNWLIFGVSLVALAGVLFAIKMMQKSKAQPELNTATA